VSAPLSERQLAEIRAQIGDAQPATNGLLESFGKSIADRVGHDHTTQREDWFCLNLAAYMGEKAAPVLRRLLDAESRAERYRIAWRMARTRAVSVGGAADRAGARVRELLPALQEAVFATIAMQMERDAALDEAARLRLAWKSARRGRATARTRTAVLEAERHSTNEALDDAVQAIAEKGQQLADAEQPRLAPSERLFLRFALELADDAIANDPADITDQDRAALERLRALSTGPTVAYRNPWQPGVLLCLEHGEGWEGMKPLAVEDLPGGGTCTAGDPADPDDVCGRDVLAVEAGEPR
jgi:hypothetical protein